MPKFSHLHTHSHYSLLSALPKLPELVAKAKECGMPALGLTDNGNMYGAIEFYKECKKQGIKPILGVDFYMAARTRNDREPRIDNKRTRIVLLAKNADGYKNLIKLVTLSNFEGFYYKPRIDKELLEKYKSDLVCISLSFSGDIATALKNGNAEMAEELCSYYKNLFGEDFFIEISHHPEIPGHQENMKNLVALAKKCGVPIVAAHDVYYLEPGDRKARNTLVSIQNEFSERTASDDDSDFSFIDQKTAEKYFKSLPEALENVEKIVDRCNLEITLGKWLFTDYKLPAGVTADESLRELVYTGIEKKKVTLDEVTKKRIEYELDIIKTKGYATYFLVVSDLLHFAHDNHILTTIRGSVAGSMVTFLAGITNVNPIEYKLPFERFLNPERPSAPDIDMDYADNRRDEMIAYARHKYGNDKVAQIGTFGTMMARGAVRDVTRALGYDYALGDRISKLIPMGAQGFPMTIDRAFEEVPELKKMYKAEKEVKDIIDMAKKIEGCARHISVHAAGVVISPIPLSEIVPLQLDPKGEGKIITQYDMHSVDENNAGLLKFDFLGIRNLAILADAVSLVDKIEKIKVDIENVPLEDAKTFEMLAKGETVGLFQLNGSGMTRFLKELKPTTIHDINAMVALYRPGPMETIPEYIRRKHNPKLVSYPDPRMKKYLEESHGLIVYQDDLLFSAIELAGYSWLEADKFRKAVGKKIPAEMAAQKEKLVEGIVKNGQTQEFAEHLWKLFEPFQAYGFNKCVTGDTKIIDQTTGEIISVEKMYSENTKLKTLSLDERYNLKNESVTDVMQNGIKNVYEVKTRTGRTIKATANHPLLTFGGWKNIGQLKPKQKIATPRIIRTSASKNVPNEAAALGYLLSEGNLCHPSGVYFYSKNEHELADFTQSVLTFPNTEITRNDSKSAVALYVKRVDQRQENSLFKWIESLGLQNKKATEKFIPAEVWTWNNHSLSILLGKMWQGDGCISEKNSQVYYATSSIKLARDVQHALLRLGILGTIHHKKFAYRGTKKDGYTVVVSHRDQLFQFAKTVGASLIDKKKNDLEDFMTNIILKNLGGQPARGTTDIIPAEVLNIIQEERKNSGLTIKELSKLTGLAERLFMKDSRKIGYQRNVIYKIGTVLNSQKLIDLSISDVFWDEIISITPCGREMTYDLTVPPHHNFIANDIVVHNSHAASYGKVAYQTAYMKANFPAIYMAAVLTAESGDVEKISEIISECKRMGIPVLAPNINESFEGFTVVKGGSEKGEDQIRFGLTTIKNFGEGIAKSIITERKAKGKFKSLEDFLNRITDKNLNKKSLEALVKAGAMDEFGERGQMLANMEDILAYNKEKNKNGVNQDSLFGNDSIAMMPSLRLQPAPEAAAADKLLWEKELLGLYISGHPLDKHRASLDARNTNIEKMKLQLKEGMIGVVAGILDELKEVRTKKGDIMYFAKMTDFSGSIEVVLFPKICEQFKQFIVLDKCIAIKGRMSMRNGTPSIVAEAVKAL